MSDSNYSLARLSEIVEQRRKELGLSQEAIQVRGGPSPAWLSTLKNGSMKDKPKPDTIESLAHALDMQVETLMAATGYKPSTKAEAAALALSRSSVSGKSPLEVVNGFKSLHPPTPDELVILQEAESLGLTFPQLTEPGFWDDDHEERRSTMLLIQQAIEGVKRFNRLQNKKGGRKGKASR